MRRTALFAGMLAILLAASPAAAQDNAEEGETAEAEQTEKAEKAKKSKKGKKGKKAKKASSEEEGESSMDDDFAMADDEDDMSATEETDTAEETDSSSSGHASTSNVFVAAPHVGVTVPSLFSDLGPWPIFGAEIGFMPPIENRPLEIAIMGRYSKPVATGSGSDQNLGEGGGQSYDWTLNQRTVTLDLVGMWRFRKVSATVHPYAMAGPRMNLMESVQTASGNGSEFGEVRETNTEFGAVVGGGVDIQLGPGTFFSELKFGWTNLDQQLTGNSNAGELVLDVGYRFYPF